MRISQDKFTFRFSLIQLFYSELHTSFIPKDSAILKRTKPVSLFGVNDTENEGGCVSNARLQVGPRRESDYPEKPRAFPFATGQQPMGKKSSPIYFERGITSAGHAEAIPRTSERCC